MRSIENARLPVVTAPEGEQDGVYRPGKPRGGLVPTFQRWPLHPDEVFLTSEDDPRVADQPVEEDRP